MLILSFLLLAFALAFFTDKVLLNGGIFAEKVHATEEINYRDVHSRYAACRFLAEHPGSITNLNCN